MTQRWIGDIVGSSGNWVTQIITWDTPFKSTPLVSVTQYETRYATNWSLPMIKELTNGTVKIGWYNASETRTIMVQAIGEV